MRVLFKITILFVVLLSSCKKNKEGGNATIEGVVLHHSKVITSATVFIKYNAKEFPGKDTTMYDAHVRVDQNGGFKFKLYKGDYYVYSYGYDYAIVAPYDVKGGAAIHLRSKEDVNLNLYVTEGD